MSKEPPPSLHNPSDVSGLDSWPRKHVGPHSLIGYCLQCFLNSPPGENVNSFTTWWMIYLTREYLIIHLVVKVLTFHQMVKVICWRFTFKWIVFTDQWNLYALPLIVLWIEEVLYFTLKWIHFTNQWKVWSSAGLSILC